MLHPLPSFDHLRDLLRYVHCVHAQPEGRILVTTGHAVQFPSVFAPCGHEDGTPCHWPNWSGGGPTLGPTDQLPLCTPHGKSTVFRLVGVWWCGLTVTEVFGPHAA
jgi:hypothetical protein